MVRGSVFNKVFWSFFLLCLFASHVGAERGQKIFRYEVVDAGVTYIHKRIMAERGPMHLHFLRVDMDDPFIIIKPALAGGGIGSLEGATSIQRRTGGVAAMNGSFFEPRRKGHHLPIGLLVIDGRVVTKSLLNRSAMGITKEKKVLFGIPKLKGEVISLGSGKTVPVWGINRPRKNDEVIIYTSEYGERTRTNRFGTELVVEGTTVTTVAEGNSQIPDDGFVISLHGSSRSFTDRLPIGSEVVLKLVLMEGWERAVQVITGGPRLLENGKVVVHESIVRENFRGSILRPTARSAVGELENGDLLFVVIEGVRGRSVGATYVELAHLLRKEGVQNAIGLDGGNSSTMSVRGYRVHPADKNGERPVSNAIIIKVLEQSEVETGE